MKAEGAGFIAILAVLLKTLHPSPPVLSLPLQREGFLENIPTKQGM